MIIAVAIGSIALAVLLYLLVGKPETYSSAKVAVFLQRHGDTVIFALFATMTVSFCVAVIMSSNTRIDQINRETAQVIRQTSSLPFEHYRRLHYNLMFDRFSGSPRDDWNEVLANVGVDGKVTYAEFGIIAAKMRFEIRSPTTGCTGQLYLEPLFLYTCGEHRHGIPDNLVVVRDTVSPLTSFTTY